MLTRKLQSYNAATAGDDISVKCDDGDVVHHAVLIVSALVAAQRVKYMFPVAYQANRWDNDENRIIIFKCLLYSPFTNFVFV
jgi:hypothetical protein